MEDIRGRVRTFVVAAAVVGALAVPTAARSATCTTKQKTARQGAFLAYQQAAPRKLRKYAQTHNTAATRAYARKQAQRLAALRKAAACTVELLTFFVGADVSADDAAEIRTAAATARDYYASIGAPPPPTEFHIHGSPATTAADFAAFYHESLDQAQSVWRADVAGVGGNGAIFIDTGALSWHDPLETAAMRAAVVAHELFHVVQSAVAGPSWSVDRGPVWLLEGAAEEAGYLAVGAPVSDQLNSAKAATAPLESYSGADGYSLPAMYPLGHVASAYLVERHGGITALVDFWRQLGLGLTTETAFVKAFGISLPDFYAAFAAYRATW